MLTLAVTSSTALVGVAVARNQELLATDQIITDRRHAEEITPMVQRVLAEAGVGVTSVGRLVADVGPGRFTGMRVGLATVKTLAFATGATVVPSTCFEWLWSNMSGDVTAVIDARRNEVFVQRRSADGAVGEASVTTPDALAASLSASSTPTSLLGDGVDRYADVLDVPALSNHSIILDRHPDAAAMACLPNVVAGVAPDLIQPLYLRDADVQINIKTRPQAQTK